MCAVLQFCIESYTLFSDFDSFLNMTAYYLQAQMAVQEPVFAKTVP
jgi:hypothetical protein